MELFKKIEACYDNNNMMWTTEHECKVSIAEAKLRQLRKSTWSRENVNDAAKEILALKVEPEDGYVSLSGMIYNNQAAAEEDSKRHIVKVVLQKRAMYHGENLGNAISAIVDAEALGLVLFNMETIQSYTGMKPPWEKSGECTEAGIAELGTEDRSRQGS